MTAEAKDARHDLEIALRERIKEFECLVELGKIVDRARGSLEQILQETVELLRRSWQHPEVACARIVTLGLDRRTSNYAPTPWTQTADVRINGRRVGHVEVAYLAKRPDSDEGPFLAEERKLIDAVANKLSHIAEYRHRDEQRLRKQGELRRRLAHLDRVNLMGQLAGSLAHEINQPLTAIAAFAQACRRLIEARQLEPATNLEVLFCIEEQALRAGAIIHRLENLVHDRRGERVRCDVNRLVLQVQSLTVPDARLQDVKLHLKLEEGLPPVLADGVQLQQLLLNLIRNAVESMTLTPAERKRVVVATERSDGEVRVSVTDRGCGLSPSASRKIFRPFFTTKPGGTGMGLSICRSIVSAHGGAIGFSRNAEGGTTFYFTVPVCAREDHEGS